MSDRYRRWKDEPLDLRRQWIAETEAFLNWAMEEERVGRPLPRVPRRRVDLGGFAPLLASSSTARAAVRHWWGRVLDTLPLG